MTASLATPRPAPPLLRRSWRAGPFSKFFAFTPLWIRIYVYFAWPVFFPAMSSGAEGPFGISPGAFLDGMALFWMAIGAYVLWGARSRVVAAVVYLAFTIPATIWLVSGPAIVLILQNAT